MPVLLKRGDVDGSIANGYLVRRDTPHCLAETNRGPNGNKDSFESTRSLLGDDGMF